MILTHTHTHTHTHTLLLQHRSHSLVENKSPSSQAREEGGGSKSFIKYLRHKSRKQRTTSSPNLSKEAMQSHSGISRPSNQSHSGISRPSIRVVVSVLQPQLYYKTLPVAKTTTVNDVIDKLVRAFAVSAEDKNLEGFYLMEVGDCSTNIKSHVHGSAQNNQNAMLGHFGRPFSVFDSTEQELYTWQD